MTTIRDEKLARDLDTMVNIVNSDPQHIARAKAKARRVHRAKYHQTPKQAPDIEGAAGSAMAGVGLFALALAVLA